MSATISQCVKELLDASPFLNEAIAHGIVSFSNLSRFIQPRVEALYGAPVKLSAIVMAARRHAEELAAGQEGHRRQKIEYEITMKTRIYDVNLRRSDSFLSSLSRLHEAVRLVEGAFLNVTIGSHEVAIAVSDSLKDELERLIVGEDVIHRKDDMVALTISFKSLFLQTPGVLYLATRRLAWEDINLTEIISTMDELTFVIEREDSMKAYKVLQSFFDEGL